MVPFLPLYRDNYVHIIHIFENWDFCFYAQMRSETENLLPRDNFLGKMNNELIKYSKKIQVLNKQNLLKQGESLIILSSCYSLFLNIILKGAIKGMWNRKHVFLFPYPDPFILIYCNTISADRISENEKILVELRYSAKILLSCYLKD